VLTICLLSIVTWLVFSNISKNSILSLDKLSSLTFKVSGRPLWIILTDALSSGTLMVQQKHSSTTCSSIDLSHPINGTDSETSMSQSIWTRLELTKTSMMMMTMAMSIKIRRKKLRQKTIRTAVNQSQVKTRERKMQKIL